ncbi:P35 family lipoprotein [Malacoplasma iowae]|uniref:P35 family lipoprotein n=1 Tax=Malacoplasma iowae TaxID=2116 RepID=UPI002A18869B|nr:P35 family lipoprotein [Malacoplasma iowae]WPL39444.1 P35 family lipoprotein [Malacoplasma iowae]
MKNKKIKWLRLLSIGGAVMAIGAVPIAMTACAKKSSSQSTTKVTPKIKSDIKIVGKFSDLVSSDNSATTDQLISKDLEKDLSKVVENSKDIKGGKVVFKSNLSEEDKKFNNGTKDYNTWKTSAASNVVYYSSTSSQLDVKSTKDLNTQISSKLTDIMNASGFTNASNKDFKLNDDNKIGVDKDLLHISVTATDKVGAKQTTPIDLVLPSSNINYVPEKATIEISGDNVNTINQSVKFTYDVGINSNVNKITDKNIGVDEGQQADNADAVLKALGWNSSAEVILKNSNIVKLDNISGNKLISKTASSKINSQKMGESIGIFNTKFTDFTVTKNDSSDNYKITVKGTPNSGYSWDDNTTSTKEFILSDDSNITVKNATLNNASNKDVDKADGGSIIALDYTGKPGSAQLNPSDNADEIKKVKEFFQDTTNANKLIDEAKKNESITSLISNAQISSINIDNIKVIQNGSGNSNRIRVALNVTPNKGSSWKDNGGSEQRIIYVKMGFAS